MRSPHRGERSARFVRPLVKMVFDHRDDYEWSLQGFGMLRAYVTRELRLHVWNSKFAVPDVTTVHDHPWNFDSLVVSGSIEDSLFLPSTSRMWPAKLHTRVEIVCGPGGGNDPDELMARGERVWLEPFDTSRHHPGEMYHRDAHQIHSTRYEDGTVTLVSREFLPDTEHAHVFVEDGRRWVSAEPRPATADERDAIIEHALARMAS